MLESFSILALTFSLQRKNKNKTQKSNKTKIEQKEEK